MTGACHGVDRGRNVFQGQRGILEERVDRLTVAVDGRRRPVGRGVVVAVEGAVARCSFARRSGAGGIGRGRPDLGRGKETEKK